ncbi:hypothetical protein D3C87_1801460 [compost metagenome]
MGFSRHLSHIIHNFLWAKMVLRKIACKFQRVLKKIKVRMNLATHSLNRNDGFKEHHQFGWNLYMMAGRNSSGTH